MIWQIVWKTVGATPSQTRSVIVGIAAWTDKKGGEEEAAS